MTYAIWICEECADNQNKNTVIYRGMCNICGQVNRRIVHRDSLKPKSQTFTEEEIDDIANDLIEMLQCDKDANNDFNSGYKTGIVVGLTSLLKRLENISKNNRG